jgi:hypothetical protein
MLPGYRTFRLFGNSAFARATPFVPDGVAIYTKGCSHPRQRVPFFISPTRGFWRGNREMSVKYSPFFRNIGKRKKEQ